MAKTAIVNKAIASIAEEINTKGSSDLEAAAMNAHPGGIEGYVRYALEARLKEDVKAEKRAIRDANKAGMSDEVSLPGLERGSFPVGIPAVRDGVQLSVHYTRATVAELKAEVQACRRENRAEDARIANWERTLSELELMPETAIKDASIGEILEAAKIRELAERN